MNRRLLCKFEIARVEKAIAGRCNLKSVQLFTADVSDATQFHADEIIDMSVFAKLAHEAVFSSEITAEQINALVTLSNRVVKSLAERTAPAVVAVRDVPEMNTPSNSQVANIGMAMHEYMLGVSGFNTGSMDNLNGLMTRH